jgi:DNA-binding transcriptional MerR regulator
MDEQRQKTYSTSQVAQIAGVHPNTVRLYEQWGFLPPVPRRSNGYRVYGERHIAHMRLARTAFRCDFVEGGIRARAAELVRTAAGGDLRQALDMARGFLAHIRNEREKAEEALGLAQKWINGGSESGGATYYKRGDVARLLNVTSDVLRDWERNGLIDIPRAQNRYRMYGPPEINRLKIIRTLRNANYSMMALVRMFAYVDGGSREDIRHVMDTPPPEEDVVSATDRWISTLIQSERDARDVIAQLESMNSAI